MGDIKVVTSRISKKLYIERLIFICCLRRIRGIKIALKLVVVYYNSLM
ncbi:MAG: hypothetical protein HOC20_12880 [Chloroflexi bacterium]|nr:hypothetical protein [Chloroflexota bacterium]